MQVYLLIALIIRFRWFFISLFALAILSDLFGTPSETKVCGTVTKVYNGDTIQVTDKKHLKIRLAEIDAPDIKQKHGITARNALRKKVLKKKVCVLVAGENQHNVRLGTVYFSNGEKINYWLVKNGHAWHHKNYAQKGSCLRGEKAARTQKIGLWASDNPQEPWLWNKK